MSERLSSQDQYNIVSARIQFYDRTSAQVMWSIIVSLHCVQTVYRLYPVHMLSTFRPQVKVFQCVEMRHPLAEGPQRVRCYPFSNHQFQSRNILDNVFFQPVESSQSFTLPRDRQLLQYGRVLLLFKMKVPGVLGRFKEVECAFIKYYDLYKPRGMCATCAQIVYKSFVASA